MEQGGDDQYTARLVNYMKGSIGLDIMYVRMNIGGDSSIVSYLEGSWCTVF